MTDTEVEAEESPVLNPPSTFSEGEEVAVSRDGETIPGKVRRVIGSADDGFTYEVGFQAVETFTEEQLSKVG